MKNNKLKIFSLAFISMMALTACDDVMAKPTGYKDDQIMETTADEEIYNNLMKIIYDDIHKNEIGSNVLNKVLYQYAVSIFGPFDTKVKGYKEGDITLATAKTGTSIDDFVKSHKAYWTVNDDGKRVKDDGSLAGDDDPASNTEKARVLARFNNIEKRVAKKIYKNISSGTYSNRNIFSEEKFLMSLRRDLKKVQNPAAAGVTTYKGLLDPAIEDIDVFNGILNRDFYWSLKTDGTYGLNTYVEDDIIPEIYREMLVEQYILDEQYNTLGRSYARKVNVVSIKSNAEYPLAARYLVNEFVDKYVLASPMTGDEEAISVAASDNKVDLDTLKILSDSWKGTTLWEDKEKTTPTEEGELLSEAGLTYDSELDVFYGTQYAKIKSDYAKINDDPLINDSSIESDFTGSGAYTKEVGLMLKEREIYLEDHTETGWYIKNGGLSSLPDSIRSRLFNVGVANALSEDPQKEIDQDRWQLNGTTWEYAKGANMNTESPYVALINGSYYLKTETTESGSANRDMVFYDNDSSTFYIVQILEAASSSKLSKVNENRYAKTRPEDAETFVADICEVVATNDTYKNLSTKHWLDKSKILYHDQEVYNYFKSNYPELFE